VGRHGLAGQPPGIARAAGDGVERRRPETGRIRVQAQDDLAAPPFDERSQTVRKRFGRTRDQSCRPALRLMGLRR